MNNQVTESFIGIALRCNSHRYAESLNDEWSFEWAAYWVKYVLSLLSRGKRGFALGDHLKESPTMPKERQKMAKNFERNETLLIH